MTDNEIIKALECCTDESYENCNECPYSTDTLSCERMKLLEDSLDLINRLKTENKRLEKEVNLVSIQFQDLQERYEEAQAEIERFRKTEIEIDDFCRRLCCMRMLNGNAIASYEDLQNYIQQEKSEAVKEFAERLENEINIRTTYSREQDKNVIHIMHNLLKEMVGE